MHTNKNHTSLILFLAINIEQKMQPPVLICRHSHAMQNRESKQAFWLPHTVESVKCFKSNLNIWMFALSIWLNWLSRIGANWKYILHIAKEMDRGRWEQRDLCQCCGLAIYQIYVAYTGLWGSQLDKYLPCSSSMGPSGLPTHIESWRGS